MMDLKKFEIPGALTIVAGNGGLPKILIETAWSAAEIYPHGAHVTAFTKTGEPPLLFMSAASGFAPGKAIRGGVPIVFPWFGPREGLPSHGFARTVDWFIKESSRLPDGSIRILLGMPAVEYYEVEYAVTIGETLTMELTVGNTGERECSFEICLHTYLQIGAIDAVSITGLKDSGYFDQLTGAGSLETAPAIRIGEEVDRIYFDTNAAVEIHDAHLWRKIRVEKSGSASTVVWNPWIEKSRNMPDFGDDEYLQMVCVESGNIAKNRINLPPSGRTTLKVVLSSVRSH